MNAYLNTDSASMHRYVQQLHVRNPHTAKAYHRILNGFLCFVAGHAEPLSVTVIQNWLRDRVAVGLFPLWSTTPAWWIAFWTGWC